MARTPTYTKQQVAAARHACESHLAFVKQVGCSRTYGYYLLRHYSLPQYFDNYKVKRIERASRLRECARMYNRCQSFETVGRHIGMSRQAAWEFLHKSAFARLAKRKRISLYYSEKAYPLREALHDLLDYFDTEGTEF